VTELADGYASLVEDTQGMLNATTQLTQRAIERLQETAAQGREKWLWLSLATVAIALALALVFAVLIARPIRQLDLAIRRMGTADFKQAVQVNGPQDLRYLGQRLDWLRTRLSELEQQQTRFLRHVSHELKTPLTAVREGAELLRDNVGGRLSPEQQDIVRIVRENTLSLQKLIEDLLSLSPGARARARHSRAGPSREIVRACCASRSSQRSARMIDIDTSLAPLVGRRPREDPHGDRQPPVERASSIRPARARSRSRFSSRTVSPCSTYPTTAPASRPRSASGVFDSFYSGKAPVDGKVKGSGLGLAIAREYAIAQSGRIEVLDRIDGQRGVRLRLWLPLSLGALPPRRNAAFTRDNGDREVTSAARLCGRCIRVARLVRDRARACDDPRGAIRARARRGAFALHRVSAHRARGAADCRVSPACAGATDCGEACARALRRK
jgi:two-component system sensor histidine kinase GlrK